MKPRLILCAGLLVALAGGAFLMLRTHSLRSQVNTLQAQVADLKAVAKNPEPVLVSAALTVTNQVIPAVYNLPSQPVTVVPVHVVAHSTAGHPGMAYDFFNDGQQALDLQVTLSNPLRMTKLFQCHLEAGPNSHCELGFNQGFSGSPGDTLTIESANYETLTVTP